MILPGVAGPEVENAVIGVPAVSEVAGPEVVFVVLASVAAVADLVDPQIFGDIAVGIALAFDALVPLFVVAVEVDSPGRSKFFAFPNIAYYASCSSSVEVVD